VSPKNTVTTSVDGRELVLSNLDKVLYPETGFTKGEVIDYYARIAPVMVPHLADRPLTMKRYPDGVDSTPFFEKHVPRHAPDWLHTLEVNSSADGDAVTYGVVDDLASLVWAANLASIEFHVPLWHAGRRRKLPAPPDFMVFDLDPGPGTTIVECCRAAVLIAAELGGDRASTYPKTSGSKGLQVYVPLARPRTWDQVRDDALGIAKSLEKVHPDLVVSNMRKSLREGKVLIDWSQNHPSKTTVAVYSLRGRAVPSASTPVTWDEVEACAERGVADLLVFTPAETLARVEADGDLFVPMASPTSAPAKSARPKRPAGGSRG
jgi:bifunctional non-homologous end joining protein LigD